MPSWIKFAITAGKTVYTAGKFVYEFVDELRVQKRVNAQIAATQRQVQSQRYQEASKNAGPKKVLH